MSTEL